MNEANSIFLQNILISSCIFKHVHEKNNQIDKNILENLNLMPTLDRQDRGDMIMTYNILNQRVEMDARFMKINTESRTRGHTKTLKIRLSKIAIRMNLLTNIITKRWNGLKPRNHQF